MPLRDDHRYRMTRRQLTGSRLCNASETAPNVLEIPFNLFVPIKSSECSGFRFSRHSKIYIPIDGVQHWPLRFSEAMDVVHVSLHFAILKSLIGR